MLRADGQKPSIETTRSASAHIETAPFQTKRVDSEDSVVVSAELAPANSPAT